MQRLPAAPLLPCLLLRNPLTSFAELQPGLPSPQRQFPRCLTAPSSGCPHILLRQNLSFLTSGRFIPCPLPGAFKGPPMLHQLPTLFSPPCPVTMDLLTIHALIEADPSVPHGKRRTLKSRGLYCDGINCTGWFQSNCCCR